MPRFRSKFPASLNLASLSSKTGFTINGVSVGDRSGQLVGSAGDVNGDGIDDLIIGALDSSDASTNYYYVVFGSHGISSSVNLSPINSNKGFCIKGVVGNQNGTSFSSVGDVNADGIDDLLFGVRSANNWAGASYVVFGARDIGNSGILSLASLNGTNGFNITGVTANDQSGQSISGAGDVNADGIDDFIIGAPGAIGYAGASYVVFGSEDLGRSGTLLLANLNGTNGFNITGITALDFSGMYVSRAGDVNADGIDDLIIGAPLAGGLGGVSYVIFGASGIGRSGTFPIASLNGVNGFNITGIVSNDQSGRSVFNAGDVNADGINDLIINSRGANKSYIIFGARGIGGFGALSLANLNGTNGFAFPDTAMGSPIGSRVLRAGDVNADGIDDLIVGGTCFVNDSAAAASYVVFGAPDIGRSGTFLLSNLNGTNGFNITPDTSNGVSCSSVGSAGDVNADGINDLMIGAPGANNSTGVSYVIFGARFFSPSLSTSIVQSITKKRSLSISEMKSTSLSRIRSRTMDLSFSKSKTESDVSISASSTDHLHSSSLSEKKSTSLSRIRSRTMDLLFSKSKTESDVSISASSTDHFHSTSFLAHSATPRFFYDRTHTPFMLNIPSRPPLSTYVSADVVNTAIAGGIATGLLFPTYANTVTNMLRIAKYCANADNMGDLNPLLYVPAPPMAFGSNEPEAAAINGVIITTTGLMAVTFAAYLLTGHFRNQAKQGVINRAHLMLSRFFALVMSYYGPNVTEVATLSMAHFYQGNRVVAMTAMAFWQAVFLWAGYQIFQKASIDSESKFSLLPFYKPSRDFANKPVRFLVLGDMAVAYSLAMLSGIKPNPRSCSTVAGSMLAVSTCYLGYVVGLRPYSSKIDQGLVTVNALLQITLSALNLATLHNEALLTTLEKVELAALCYTYLQMAILLAQEFIKWYGKYKAREITSTRENVTLQNLLNMEDMLSFTLDVDSKRQVSRSPLLDIMLDDEADVNQPNGTIAIDIDPISLDASVSSLIEEPPVFSHVEDIMEDGHIAIDMSPQPLKREESPQLADSTDREESDGPGLSEFREDSLDLESQLLEGKRRESLSNALSGFFYTNQTLKMEENSQDSDKAQSNDSVNLLLRVAKSNPSSSSSTRLFSKNEKRKSVCGHMENPMTGLELRVYK